jgi:hypothetical protein
MKNQLGWHKSHCSLNSRIGWQVLVLQPWIYIAKYVATSPRELTPGCKFLSIQIHYSPKSLCNSFNHQVHFCTRLYPFSKDRMSSSAGGPHGRIPPGGKSQKPFHGKLNKAKLSPVAWNCWLRATSLKKKIEGETWLRWLAGSCKDILMDLGTSSTL